MIKVLFAVSPPRKGGITFEKLKKTLFFPASSYLPLSFIKDSSSSISGRKRPPFIPVPVVSSHAASHGAPSPHTVKAKKRVAKTKNAFMKSLILSADKLSAGFLTKNSSKTQFFFADTGKKLIEIQAAFFLTILFAATQMTIVMSISGRVFPRMRSTFIK